MNLSPVTSSLLGATPHGFFTRKGGISAGAYTSLNCGPGSKDVPEHVLENRRRVQQYFANAEALCTLYQEHTATALIITEAWQQFNAPKADAMATRTPGIALGILTADCAPVLLADSNAGVIAAAHAGWQGAFKGIISNTIAAMVELGASPASITAAIGPCIKQESYQVDTLFHSKFLAQDPEYKFFFDRDTSSPSHYRFNLAAFVAAQLQKKGVHKIDILPNNTYIEESDFFSFRRSTHRKEPDYGRQISVICLPA